MVGTTCRPAVGAAGRCFSTHFRASCVYPVFGSARQGRCARPRWQGSLRSAMANCAGADRSAEEATTPFFTVFKTDLHFAEYAGALAERPAFFSVESGKLRYNKDIAATWGQGLLSEGSFAQPLSGVYARTGRGCPPVASAVINKGKPVQRGNAPRAVGRLRAGSACGGRGKNRPGAEASAERQPVRTCGSRHGAEAHYRPVAARSGILSGESASFLVNCARPRPGPPSGQRAAHATDVAGWRG